MNDREYRRRQIIRGKLFLYYDLLDQIADLDTQIDETRHQYGGVKAVRYGKASSGGGGLTNDEKMATMTVKIDYLTEKKQKLTAEAQELYQQLHFGCLNDIQTEIVESIFRDRMNYQKTGDKIGYSLSQTFRILNEVMKIMGE